MIRYRKNNLKRIGFTLLEMVLVIAILLMISGYIVSTFTIVNRSHLRVTTVNDMHDYASLTLRAIENNICNATKIAASGSDGHTISCGSGDTAVKLDGNPILSNFQQYKAQAANGTIKDKWELTMTYSVNQAKKLVTVTITLKDNYTGNVSYTDSKTIYCPSCKSMAGSGSTLWFTTDPQP